MKPELGRILGMRDAVFVLARSDSGSGDFKLFLERKHKV